MSASYETQHGAARHPVWGVSLPWSMRVLLSVLMLVTLVIGWRASSEWKRIEKVPLGPYVGVATLVGDPQPIGAGARVVLRIRGWRYEASLYGANARRVMRHLQGESVRVSGEREALNSDGAHRKRVRHIAGRFTNVRLGGEWTSGSALTRATNRLRRLVARGTSVLPANDAALTLGLLIGDDRAQPREMIQAFRDAGLSHLTAVSGQNIAFVLAVAAPLLTRLRSRARLGTTWALLGMFVLMTRAEPSVLRAAMMAGAAAVCFSFGWTQRTLVILVLSAAVLLVVDPMLLWSVGFWLSVGATAGLATLAAPLSRRLALWRVPRVLVGPLSTTLAAQLGTLVPMFVVFGRFSTVGIVTNLLAVPVAGAVMLVGLPVCFVAGVVGDGAGAILTLPVMAGVRWVWWVAVLGQRLS